MTWLLLIQIVTVSTCAEGYRHCPPQHPPVERRQTFTSAAQCEAHARAYRRTLPARRVVLQKADLTMEQQTTVQCVAQAKR
jgi:hypothetical protein